MKSGISPRIVATLLAVSLISLIAVSVTADTDDNYFDTMPFLPSDDGLMDEQNWRKLVNQEQRRIKSHHWQVVEDDSAHLFHTQMAKNNVRLTHFELYANHSIFIGVDHATGNMADNLLLHFRFAPIALVEFQDINRNGAYDYKVDREVSRIDLVKDLGKPLFEPLQIRERTWEGHTYQVMQAATLDGHFRLTLFYCDVNITINHMELGPNKIKFDVEIIDYPFEEADSKIALVASTLHQEKRQQLMFQNNANQDMRISVKEKNGLERGYLSWLDNATVDGDDTEVVYSTIRDKKDVVGVAFAFEQGSHIIYDPEMGIIFHPQDFDSPHLLQSSHALFAATAVLTVLILFAITILSRR